MLSPQQIESIEREIARQPEHVQEHYRTMVAAGESPRFAAMCAMRQAPETRYSDRTFNAERRQRMEKMAPKALKRYQEMARQAGISTQNKFYVGALGRPNDPAAWVSTVDEAKAVCKRKNLTADGIVKHQGTPVDPPKKKALADDIRDAHVQRILQSDPGKAAACASDPRKLRQVQEEVVARHGRPGTS